MRPIRKVMVAAALAACLTGCGTFANSMADADSDPKSPSNIQIYGGVRKDAVEGWNCLTGNGDPQEGNSLWSNAGGVCFYSTDMVLSAVGDTVTLPITVPYLLMDKYSSKNAHSTP
jgi:hypothetical protein